MQYYSAKHQAQKTVSLALQPSYLLAVFYSLLGIFACVCLMFLPLSLRVICAICFLVLISVVYAILLQALLALPCSLTHVDLNIKGDWTVTHQNGKKTLVLIHPSTFVASYLTVVNVQLVGKKSARAMVIIPRRVHRDSYRKLRVLLRWSAFEKTDAMES